MDDYWQSIDDLGPAYLSTPKSGFWANSSGIWTLPSASLSHATFLPNFFSNMVMMFWIFCSRIPSLKMKQIWRRVQYNRTKGTIRLDAA